MSRTLATRLCLLTCAATLPGCDLSALTDFMCLSRVLDLADLDVDELKGADADARLAEALSLAKEVLGELPVMDCEAEESFGGLLDATGGTLVNAWSPEDVADQTGQLIDDGVARGGEVALLIDTTGSMQDDTMALRRNIDAVLAEVEQKDARISVAFFGDNQNCDGQDWYHRNKGGLLSPDDDRIVKAAGNWEGALTGGCYWQESMYDAIWKTADELAWQSDDRTIIVITDAEAHEDKTNHSESEVSGMLKQEGIVLDTILVGIGF
jgi:hypothetical protein